MTDTIREQIIHQITTAAQTLSTHPVERARRSFAENEIGLQPFISIWDGDNETIEKLFDAKKQQMALAIECVWNADNSNPSVSANALVGVVIKTITQAMASSELIDDLDANSYTITYPNDGITFTSLLVNFVVKYSTLRDDPFTQPTF